MKMLPLVSCFVAFAGCQPRVLFFLPDSRTATDRAHEIEPRCSGLTPESAAPMLSPSAIESVEPAYSYVKSGPNDHEARLRGALLHVRPLPGMTKESLARALECHEARVTLGREQPFDDDPYVLADTWVDIDVDSEGDRFAVNARVDEIETARHVLERAKKLASRR